MWILYQLLLGLGLLAATPWMLLRRGRRTLEVARARWHPTAPGAEAGSLWIHAVSVGEVGVAATLVEALPSGLPLLMTTVTPTGQELARQRLGGRARVTWLPFDLTPCVGPFLRRHRPRALICVEGDLWPLLCSRLRRRGVPVLVVNGRVGDRSYARMRRLRPLLGPLLGPVAHWGLQSERDRDRLLALGVPAARLTVTGNLKFDTPEAAPEAELAARLRRLAAGRPILVAGSTMQGEEEAVLAAARELAGQALLVLAPRHPERFDAVAEHLTATGLSWQRRASWPVEGEEPAAESALDVVLLDSLGELAGLYALAAGAFIGGTLVPTGGHNPLEAMRHGVPVVAGPSMENFRAMAEDLDAAGAWARVADAAGLAAAWRGWLEQPEAAAELGRRGVEFVAASRGAVERTTALLAAELGPGFREAEAPVLTAVPPLPPPAHSPWQTVYGAAHRARRRWYGRRAARLPRPVISVGNLHWGGTGKTPVVAALAAHLRDRGHHVAILTRGYGGRGKGVRLVSDGGGPLLGPLVAGDEPVLLAGELPGVAVLVGPDRHRAGLHALERLQPAPDVFLLDDGFSHLRLARDLDLLLLPAGDPWGGGRLPPGGRLREPLAAVARADAVLVTGCGLAGAGTAAAEALRHHGFTGPGFTSRTVARPPVSTIGTPLEAGSRVLAVAGIARPERFFDAAAAAGLEIAGTLRFGDHHAYPPASLERIQRSRRELGAAWVLATDKDAVKLYGRLDAPLARLGVRAEPAAAALDWLAGRLQELLSAGKDP